jgi:hypothetical protein
MDGKQNMRARWLRAKGISDSEKFPRVLDIPLWFVFSGQGAKILFYNTGTGNRSGGGGGGGGNGSEEWRSEHDTSNGREWTN